MCDVVGQALRAGVSRRNVLRAAMGGAAALGVAACSGNTGPAANQPTTAGTSAPAAPPTAEGARTQLILLGTSGGPPEWPGSTRAGIASALLVGDRYYIIDASAGVVRQAREARLGNWQNDTEGPLDALRAIFLTHLHSDHVVDLNNVLSTGLYNGLARADRPVSIFGPGNRGAVPPLFGDRPAPQVTAPANPTPGTAEMIDLMVATFATDYNDRAFDGGSPAPAELFRGFDVPIPARYMADPDRNPHPRMSPVPFHEDDRVCVSATLVQHAPVFPALAYRFDTDAGSVVFSGDTGPSENLVELARGADVLVHEVIDTEWVDQLLPPPRTPEQEGLFRHLLGAHTAAAQVAAVACAAEVGTLVLSHLVPGNGPQERWLRAREGFPGRIVVGQDLTTVDLGPASR
jgi:ribonuclease BN (tRNA processing enzyme)